MNYSSVYWKERRLVFSPWKMAGKSASGRICWPLIVSGKILIFSIVSTDRRRHARYLAVSFACLDSSCLRKPWGNIKKKKHLIISSAQRTLSTQADLQLSQQVFQFVPDHRIGLFERDDDLSILFLLHLAAQLLEYLVCSIPAPLFEEKGIMYRTVQWLWMDRSNTKGPLLTFLNEIIDFVLNGGRHVFGAAGRIEILQFQTVGDDVNPLVT